MINCRGQTLASPNSNWKEVVSLRNGGKGFEYFSGKPEKEKVLVFSVP